MPWSCVRRPRGRSVVSGPVLVLAFPFGLLPALPRVAGCPARVSLPFACQYAIPCGLCIPQAWSGCPSGSCRVSAASVCARAPAAYLPPCIGMAHALRAVLLQGAVRTVPRGSCPSAFPAPVLCSTYLALWGVAQSLRPLAWFRVARPPAGRTAFASWLCALLGRHGGGSRLGVRRLGLGALPRPDAYPRGVRPGPATHWLWVRGVWAWGPVTIPTARALASWLCAPWGRHEGARGVSCLGGERPGLGAHKRPTACLLGARWAPATHWLWVRGVWAW